MMVVHRPSRPGFGYVTSFVNHNRVFNPRVPFLNLSIIVKLKIQGWGNQHFNSQAAYMTAVLIILSDSVCAQNLYIKSENWSGHGLTCLGGSPSHEIACSYVYTNKNVLHIVVCGRTLPHDGYTNKLTVCACTNIKISPVSCYINILQ